MIAINRGNKVLIRILLWGLILLYYAFVVPNLFAQTYDFDEGIEVLTEGLISENREILKNKKIAVFGIIESRSGKKWDVSSHIEDGIVDALVNNRYRVIERRRIQDVIKKEIKKVTDLWFDQDQVAQFGKLVGADIVVTGRYVPWGRGMLKISIRAINVADGEIVAADKVKVHTDRIANLLKSEEDEKHLKEAKVSPEKPVVKPATEDRKTTDLLGSVWHQVEGPYHGTWVRRGNSNVFDATWPRAGVTAKLTMKLSGNKVKITRTDTKGPGVGTETIIYEGTISEDGKTVSGTEWTSVWRQGWSATIVQEETKDGQLETHDVSRDLLGSVWHQVEGPYHGTWVRRGNSNVFDATWGVGVRAVLNMTLNGNKVKISRKDTVGPSVGWKITYEGTISTDGTSVSGQEWYPGGTQSWSAKIVQ